ncbi:MAG: hypothetical protein U0Z44_12945 [Kouleothrix sp.]
MLDQGVHLIDLARWFMGDFAEVGVVMSAPSSGTWWSKTTASRC